MVAEPEWSSIVQLRRLRDVYEVAARTPAAVTDEALLAAVRETFWGTNSFAFVEASFAIIAPACALRPHLTKTLLRAPVRAAIASGVVDPAEIAGWGRRCGVDATVYVRSTATGRAWLSNDLPRLEALVTECVAEALEWVAAEFPGPDFW